ncbi:MAG: hypothetical protein JWO13_97 [Acidobacteriales bacterium]|nr:hypothetical protein [Terriglobales bacterium]
MPKFSDWPEWLQVAVLFPHAMLGFVATWLWWPKTDKEWSRFGLVAAYLLVFFLVMHFVFGLK